MNVKQVIAYLKTLPNQEANISIHTSWSNWYDDEWEERIELDQVWRDEKDKEYTFTEWRSNVLTYKEFSTMEKGTMSFGRRKLQWIITVDGIEWQYKYIKTSAKSRWIYMLPFREKDKQELDHPSKGLGNDTTTMLKYWTLLELDNTKVAKIYPDLKALSFYNNNESN